MSIKIPISVELGNSISNIKKLDASVSEFAQNVEKKREFNVGAESTKTLKTQLREANLELQNAILNFGKLSPQAQTAASKVANLRDVIEDAGNAAKAADLDDRFQSIGQAISGVTGAFQTVTALQAVFGAESAKTEEALKKVQATLALTQGITAIFQGVKAFQALGAALINSNALVKIYNAGTVVASVVTTAFGGAVNATSLAFKGLAVAIASTGIGLIIVALGTLIPLLIKWITSSSSAEKALGSLKKTEEELGDSISRTNDLIKQRNQALDFQTQKAVLLAKIAGKSQDDINKIEEKGRLEGIALAMADRDKATNARKAQEEKNQNILEQINKTGSKKEKEEAAKSAKEILDQLVKDEKDKSDKVTQLVQDAALKRLEAQANASQKERDEAKKASDKRVADESKLAEKLKQAKDAAGKILIDLERRNASEAQQKIFEIQDRYAEKRKTLAEAGIKDFTAINKAEAEEIASVQKDSNNQALQARQSYENALFNVIVNGIKKRKEIEAQALSDLRETRELQFRAEISGIKDAYQVRLMELRNAENKEMDALEQAYEDKKISLEKFLADQAAIEAFYANKKKTEQEKAAEEEQKKLEEVQSFLADSISAATEELVNALVAGEDPFRAAFASIANSLGGYLQKLGKEAILASAAFQRLRELIFTPAGIGAGVALIALGTLIKAAFKKKSDKGFATGGFVSGPGTETSDSIQARLSKGEYVVKAKSVRKYGVNVLEKINKGQVPVAQMARAVDPSRALVNRSEFPFTQKSRALVNRADVIQLQDIFGFSNGGLVTGSSRGTSRALVNRFEAPEIVPIDKSRALVNRTPSMNESFQREIPYIATTKVSGQDLRIILERADRRYSTAT